MLGYNQKEIYDLIEELVEVFADVIGEELAENGYHPDDFEAYESLDASDILQVIINYKKRINKKGVK